MATEEESRRILDDDENGEKESDSSSVYLDLTSYQLHDLEEIDLPSGLIELDLTANRLSSLDSRIGLLSQLKKLSLRQNLFEDAGIEPISSWTSISGLQECVSLEELYLSHNGIQKMEGLATLVNLRVLDISSNKITVIEDIDNLTRLVDLWLNDNNINSLEGLDLSVSGSKQKLTTIYLERNPCANLPDYSTTLRRFFPNLEQLDSEVLS